MGLSHVTWKRLLKAPILGISLIVFVLILAACPSDQADTPPAAEEPAAAEEQVAEEPAAEEEPAEEEAAAEEEPEEEPPVEEPAEEEPAEEEPAEEPVATEEATEEPAEEPAEEEPTEEEAAAEEAMADAVDNGGYIVTITGGCGCHFNREVGGLAGGNDFDGPFGVVYARNITPDPETGIGNWTPEEVAAALRLGVRPDGTQLHPIMPYHDFSVLSDQEALAVADYLLAQDPISNEVPDRELTSEPEPFTPASEAPAEPPTDPVVRGEQLVTIARCGGCHTPAGDETMFLAGGPISEDEIAANITPDEETGIGAWSAEEIAHFMQTGEKPDGNMADGSMAQQIDRRFHLLTDDDALAVGEYLLSIPAVSNDPFSP